MKTYTTNDILIILADLFREAKKDCWEHYDRLYSKRGIKDETDRDMLLIQITKDESKMATIEAIHQLFKNEEV